MHWLDYRPYFEKWEFDCRCGCDLNNMTKEHMDRLLMARIRAGIPFVISSGSRCRDHNKSEGGVDLSDHLTGEGTDIEATSSRARFLILEALFHAGFKRIGIYEWGVHVGSRQDNPQEVAWL